MTAAIALSHPLVRHHLTILRDVCMPPSLFRGESRRLAMLLGAAATADLPLKDMTVSTPITDYVGSQLSVCALRWCRSCGLALA